MSAASIESGRFYGVGQATNIPGSCGICSTSSGPYIDTGRYFKLFGRLYICMNCLTEMARVAGLFEALRPEPVDPVVNLTYKEFKETVDGLANGLSGSLTDLLNYLYGASIVPLLSDSDEIDGDAESDDGEDVGSESESDEADIEDFGIISVEGPDDLSDDSVNGDSDRS